MNEPTLLDTERNLGLWIVAGVALMLCGALFGLASNTEGIGEAPPASVSAAERAEIEDTNASTLSWYRWLGRLAALACLAIAAGLVLSGPLGWRLSVAAATASLVFLFAFYGLIETSATDPEDSRKYYIAGLFTVVIFVFGYIATPQTQRRHGLAVELEESVEV